MLKHPYLESATHHLLIQIRKISDIERLYNSSHNPMWGKFVNTLEFSLNNLNTIIVTWKYPQPGEYEFSLNGVRYYTRGDIKHAVKYQKKMMFQGDPIEAENEKYFYSLAIKISQTAGFIIQNKNNFVLYNNINYLKRHNDEEHLSYLWAKTVDVKKIDVVAMNEACTAPEMRYIISKLGNIRGKSLLDIGCGLGEASVYFALKGAKVTAIDISKSMIDVIKRLSKRYNVQIVNHQSTIENIQLPYGKKFDIIYVGNLLHHVNIDKALEQVRLYLKTDGIFVNWEPVHYNPIINIYRKIAVKVRSKNEQPIKLSDIEKFHRYFSRVETKWFWFSTLIIFIIMVFLQKRDPNKERLWKVVVAEEKKWKFLYKFLERFDIWLLKFFPILNPFCWNVVIISSGKKI